MAEQITDEKLLTEALSGIFVFSDKVISQEDAERIKRRFRMTKVELLYEKEKQEAIEEAVKKAVKEVTAEKNEADKRADQADKRADKADKRASTVVKKAHDKEVHSAEAFLMEGDSVEKVSRCLDMPLADVEKIYKKVIRKQKAI